MTNPDNTVGTNAGYDGRTTPNAFNDILGTFTRGIVSGWACTPKSGMTVQLGGDGSTRDVAIAEDNAGNKTTINNRTATPVEITLAGAPATGNRIDSIVAYVDSAQSGQGATDVDFPSITGIIAVSGTAAGTPTQPTEAQIRTAITNDGADGASSFYVILANITVGQGVTTIGSGVISAGTPAQMWAGHLIDRTVGSDKLTDKAVWADNINWTTLPYAYAYTDVKQDSFIGVIPYDTFKANNGFTLSSGGFRVPKSGYYRITARMSGFGTQGWIRVHIASSTSDSSASTVVGSGIVRFTSGQYHSVEVSGVIAYATAGQYIYARNIDSNFDLNSGMDAGIMGTTISAQFIGN